MDARARTATTLPEVLVVIGLMGLLMSLTAPAVMAGRDRAQKAACQNRLRQMALGLLNYESKKGRFPIEVFQYGYGAAKTSYRPWQVEILGEIGEAGLASQAQSDYARQPRPLNPAHPGLSAVVKTYLCPLDSRLDVAHEGPFGHRAAFTDYMGVAGSLNGAGVLAGGFGCRVADITDGTSNTLMIGERPPPDTFEAGWWYARHPTPQGGPDNTWTVEALNGVQAESSKSCFGSPGPGGIRFRYAAGLTSNPCDKYHFWSFHAGGGNFAFADGSVKAILYSARDTLPALATRSGGETVEIP